MFSISSLGAEGKRYFGVSFLEPGVFLLCCCFLTVNFLIGPSAAGFIFCYADEEEAKETEIKEEATANNIAEGGISGEEEDEKGFFDFRDPFISGLPKEVETKIVAMPAQTSEAGYEAVELAPEEFDYSSLSVTGLLWGSDKPKAIINNDIFGIGSVINGATIVQIDAKGILFEYNGKQFLLQRSSK